MPIAKELLEILCCPKTKVGLEELPANKIEALNKLINDKKLNYANGDIVDEPLQEALITVDKTTVYRVDEDIPIMLIDKGIPVENL